MLGLSKPPGAPQDLAAAGWRQAPFAIGPAVALPPQRPCYAVAGLLAAGGPAPSCAPCVGMAEAGWWQRKPQGHAAASRISFRLR